MRTLDVTCDCGCGATMTRGARPATWWSLEDQGGPLRTGPLDFATLTCLQRWIADPRVRDNPIYAPDFPVPDKAA